MLCYVKVKSRLSGRSFITHGSSPRPPDGVPVRAPSDASATQAAHCWHTRLVRPVAPLCRASCQSVGRSLLSLSVRADSTDIWRPGTANALQPLNDVVLMAPKPKSCPRCGRYRKGKGPQGPADNDDPCRCCSCPGSFCEHAAGGCQEWHSAGTTSTQCSTCQVKNKLGKRKAKQEAAHDLVQLGEPLDRCHIAAPVRPSTSAFALCTHLAPTCPTPPMPPVPLAQHIDRRPAVANA